MVCSMENIIAAEKKARKKKAWQYGVRLFDKNPADNLQQLQQMLLNKAYRTSDYKVFKVYEQKEREVYRLPYYPDRITHHAIMNVLEPIFVKVFTADTYSCIKNRGIHAAAEKLKQALKDSRNTQYCLKLDIRKFYPSINHDVLKQLLRRKIKDEALLWLLDEIIDSAPGLPIGNYLSQYLSNFYLTFFDHWIKEDLRLKYYFRYADDIVILAETKEHLHTTLLKIKEYLNEKLLLEVKQNYQVFPVSARGIDFLGYRFFHTHTLLRKRIKQSFARMINRNKNQASVASYIGWAMHCNSRHLIKKLLNEPV